MLKDDEEGKKLVKAVGEVVDNFEDRLIMTSKDELTEGQTLMLYGIITDVDSVPDKEGWARVKINNGSITLLVGTQNLAQHKTYITEDFEKNNPNDPLASAASQLTLAEALEHRIGEAGFFVAELLTKEPKCVFVCKTVILGKKQTKMHKFNN